MKPHIKQDYHRIFFMFAVMLLVLFTSCPAKAGIKALAGFPINKEQQPAKGSNNIIDTNREICSFHETYEAKVFQTVSLNYIDFLPTVLLTLSFLFLFSFQPESKESKHPIYHSTRKVPKSIPLFLEYRKSIVPFIS